MPNHHMQLADKYPRIPRYHTRITTGSPPSLLGLDYFLIMEINLKLGVF